jgi:hypothetical protein
MLDKAKEAARLSAQNAQAGLGHAGPVQTPAGTGGRLGDSITPTKPPAPVPHDPDKRPARWSFPVGGVVVVDPGVDGYPVSCLRKQYLPDGRVVFFDVCTTEIVTTPTAD